MAHGVPEATIAALALLYTRRYHRFLRVAEAIVGDVELARDAVQEAFVRAIRSRFDYRGEGSLEGWVWRSVVNTARTLARDRPPPHLPLHEVSVEAATSNGRARPGDVRGMLATLPERQRLVLFLRHYADLDYRAIADALDIRPGTVGATLSHAHDALRRLLDGEEVAR